MGGGAVYKSVKEPKTAAPTSQSTSTTDDGLPKVALWSFPLVNFLKPILVYLLRLPKTI